MGMERHWRAAFKTEALTAQDGRCLYCHSPLSAKDATADHKWPRARRGGTERNNIGAACRPCNQAKGCMSHIEFYRLIDRRQPVNVPAEILLVWASRKIWKRTKKACERIERRAR